MNRTVNLAEVCGALRQEWLACNLVIQADVRNYTAVMDTRAAFDFPQNRSICGI